MGNRPWNFAKKILVWTKAVLKGPDGGWRGPMYTYGWFMLMFGWNQQNSVKQLSLN